MRSNKRSIRLVGVLFMIALVASVIVVREISRRSGSSTEDVHVALVATDVLIVAAAALSAPRWSVGPRRRAILMSAALLLLMGITNTLALASHRSWPYTGVLLVGSFGVFAAFPSSRQFRAEGLLSAIVFIFLAMFMVWRLAT